MRAVVYKNPHDVNVANLPHLEQEHAAAQARPGDCPMLQRDADKHNG